MVARALIRAPAGLSGIRADCDALARPLLSFAGLSAVLPFIHAGTVLALARHPALALTRRLSRLTGSQVSRFLSVISFVAITSSVSGDDDLRDIKEKRNQGG